MPLSGEQRDPPEDRITPERLYVSRRAFIAGAGMVAASALLAGCVRGDDSTIAISPEFCNGVKASATVDDLGDKLTTCKDITNYNNFYEFSYEKEDVAPLSRNFMTSPWTVSVGGLVNKPGRFSVDELVQKYHPEERVYRMRCVEAWSMVIPWLGFPLSRLLEDVQPAPEAKFVHFLSFYDPKQMPGDRSLDFPYSEGLRLDEAMHGLTILATGLYGKSLPPQDGAPIRLVVPWKYGFKSAKSIVSIELTAEMPQTFWPDFAPDEYGFYANVNPDVTHPRWSQASERRIGELARRKTLLFNGYSQVSPLYEGMDLTRYF
ncbi:MAG: protein-methionine-sulfoxide reductase catalytic subunit MsrP [Chloroflexi bacterium]|nr:protein-methionine-sulfoxide reductase catalytic subunit MsrP [Chloroflexota bacterium]